MPMHMRHHLTDYINQNFEEIGELVKNVLEHQHMTLEQYLAKMEQSIMCGYEITLLILVHMYKTDIVVIHSDKVWMSRDVPVMCCPIVVVQNLNGEFLGMKVMRPWFIGGVPSIRFKKDKKSTFKLHTLTPIKNNKGGSVKIALQSDLGVSPIFVVKSEKPEKTTDSEFAIESSHKNAQQLYSSDELEVSMSEKSDTDVTMSDDNNEETENAVGEANSVCVPEVLPSELNHEKSTNSDGDIDSGAKDMEKGTTTLKYSIPM